MDRPPVNIPEREPVVGSPSQQERDRERSKGRKDRTKEWSRIEGEIR